jgi:hypothetical protein
MYIRGTTLYPLVGNTTFHCIRLMMTSN